ncbi:hypothetical protein FQN57_001438 [Myotisia sp. PD_48]|nr:hypothetical protein FQN57_001438 [Myotisia sp. PD_48]
MIFSNFWRRSGMQEYPVRFIPSQVDLGAVTSEPKARANPLVLTLRDICMCLRLLLRLPRIVLPTYTTNPTNELARRWSNVWNIIGLVFVSCLQLVLLVLGAGALSVLPGAISYPICATLYGISRLTCIPIQGPSVYEARPEPATPIRLVEERWVFINGVVTTGFGFEQNCRRLARTFHRPIVGIHNATYGLFGDLLECILQRSFSYKTHDVRFAYDYIKGLTVDPKLRKVVIISHSQGAIVTSMVLDMLYADLSVEQLSKIEVYTFGSAASYMNNPLRAVDPFQPQLATNVVKYIEHYVNSEDPVPQWGVLANAQGAVEIKYAGKVFIRRNASGHMFNQHYLARMFPLTEDEADRDGDDGLPFLDQPVQVDEDTLDAREVHAQHNAILPLAARTVLTGLELDDIDIMTGKPVRELSRLWRYMGGNDPDEVETDAAFDMFVRRLRLPWTPPRYAAKPSLHARRLHCLLCRKPVRPSYSNLKQASGPLYEYYRQASTFPDAGLRRRDEATESQLGGSLQPRLDFHRVDRRYIVTETTNTQPLDAQEGQSAPVISADEVPEEYYEYTEPYIMQTGKVPSGEEYRAFSKIRLGAKTALDVLTQRKLMQVDARYSQLPLSPWVRCDLVARITPLAGQSHHLADIEVSGIGRDKTTAQRTAYFFLAAELHSTSLLRILDKRIKDLQLIPKIPPQLTYLYCHAAQFLLVPTFSIEGHYYDRFLQKEWFTIKIDLLEHDITAIATAPTLCQAAILAYRFFHQQAILFSKREPFPPDIFDEAMSLTPNSAKRFLAFYSSRSGKKIDFDIRCNAKTYGQDTVHFATVFMDQIPASQPAINIDKSSAIPNAYLAAAVGYIRKDPYLWQEFIEHTRKISSDSVDLQVNNVCTDIFDTGISRLNKLRASAKPSRKQPHPLVSTLPVTALSPAESGNRFQTHSFLLPKINPHENPPLPPTVDEIHKAQILERIANNTFNIIVDSGSKDQTTRIIPQMVCEQSGSNYKAIVAQSRELDAFVMAHDVADERNEDIGQSIGYDIPMKSVQPSSIASITYSTSGRLLAHLLHQGDAALEAISHIFIDDIHERGVSTDFLITALKNAVSRLSEADKPSPKIIFLSRSQHVNWLSQYTATTTSDGTSTPAPITVVPDNRYPIQQHFIEDILPILYPASPDCLEAVLYRHLSDDTIVFIYGEKNVGGLKPPNTNESVGKPTRDFIPGVSGKGNSRNDITAATSADAYVPIQLIVSTVAHIANTTDEGSILVVLPGNASIKQTTVYLNSGKVKATLKLAGFEVVQSNSESGEAIINLERSIKKNYRSIILATTITDNVFNRADIRYVVDCGKINLASYDPTVQLGSLTCQWADKSTLERRQDCARLSENGHYYAMFSKARLESLAASIIPATHRYDIQSECLLVKSSSAVTNFRGFFDRMVDPPSAAHVGAAISSLQSIGALDQNENVTALGRTLSWLPFHPVVGKMLVLGIIFRCLEPAIIIAASLRTKSLFLPPTTLHNDRSKLSRPFFAQGSSSDHIAIVNAFRALSKVRGQKSQMESFCKENKLSLPIFSRMSKFVSEVLTVLQNTNFIPFEHSSTHLGGATLNQNSEHLHLVRSLLSAALPLSHVVVNENLDWVWRTRHGQGTMLSNRSAVSDVFQAKPNATVAFSQRIRFQERTKPILMETTAISPLMTCLFGGERLNINNEKLVVDSLSVGVRQENGAPEDSSQAADKIFQYRKLLDQALATSYEDMLHDASNNNRPWAQSTYANELAEILASLNPDSAES